jgi:hypothetical protein
MREMLMNYILDEAGNPVAEPDIITWARWFERHNRVVMQTAFKDQGIAVSTVFLGLNHQFGDGPPLLWETMVFDNLPSFAESYCDRYSSLEEAKKGHQKAVEWVIANLKEKNIIAAPTFEIERPIKKGDK